jgi:hypothetical protein
MPAVPTTTSCASDQQVILCVLGHSDAALDAHLAVCETCRSRVETYRSVLAATRGALSAGSGRVNLVSLEESCVLEERECQVGDEHHVLRVTLSAREGRLVGHLRVDETCTCWQNAPVRLFSSHGLVAGSRVDADGDFSLPMPESGKRYSLGLVLNRHDAPELQIIGSLQVG